LNSTSHWANKLVLCSDAMWARLPVNSEEFEQVSEAFK